ncbi:MAG: MBL fold metallo-hydrolase [Oscillospiraceae bacterium]
MKMTFIGAAREVTGSCTYLEACGKRFLVDFGMEQGHDVYENAKIPCAPAQIDFVLLTHAHIDHSGLLPFLTAGGFTGQIHATAATANLCEIMLRDSAHIQMFEAEWKNRKGKRSGREETAPLYTMEDAEAAIAKFVPHAYDEAILLADGIRTRFIDAGHLLGSASIELALTENGETRTIVFSGDVGNNDQPLICDPTYIEKADYAVMESTYGDRLHERAADYAQSLADLISQTFAKGGNVVIPSFAVGRTQELLYFLRQIKERGLVMVQPDFEVYVDSPLAIEATEIFNRNTASCFDAEALAYVKSGRNPIAFPGLKTAVTADDSRAINFSQNPKVIISASGMCEAGRIRHHLKHNLWRAECTILFVGYQAAGTLGRAISEGAKKVQLFGEEISVNARIETLPGMSAHADKNGLIRWITAIGGLRHVFINHGEKDTAERFAALLHTEHQLAADAPYTGWEFDLLADAFVSKEIPAELEHKPAAVSAVFARLTAALERLTALVKASRGRTNKDLARLTDRINDLCDKFE